METAQDICCVNCRYGRNDLATENENALLCTIEPVEMNPNDFCYAFELRSTEDMIKRLRIERLRILVQIFEKEPAIIDWVNEINGE